jgi:hypothetical protein
MVNKFRFNQDKYQMMEKKEISKMEETMNSYNAKVCLSLKFVLYFSPWKALINDSVCTDFHVPSFFILNS